MEKQYSVDFFTSFVENLQNLCQMYLNYEQFVEVTGYISVETDNNRRERYVLSEILQTTGNILSESYCSKVSKNPAFCEESTAINTGRRALQELQRSPSCRGKRQQQYDEDQNWTRATHFGDDEPQVVSVEVPPAKVKRLNPMKRVRSPSRSRHEQRTNSLTQYSQESSGQMGQVPDVEGQSYHELDSQSSFGISSELRKANSFDHIDEENISTWTTDRSDNHRANRDSSLYHAAISSRTEHQKRSWHVTKEEFPSDTFSKRRPVPQPQVEKEDAVSEESLRTSVGNLITNSSFITDSSNHDVALDSFPTSGDKSTSNNTVTCKQEPDLQTSEDAVVYTDIDDDRTSSQDYSDSKPLNTGPSDSEKDYIVIDLDSDNEDLSLDDPESVTYAVSTADAPQRDISSFSKPQQFAVNRLIQFLEIKKIQGPVCSLPPEQLDPVLGEFYLRVRKCGGQEFGSRSLKTIQQYLEIYFRSNNYPASITKGPQFQNSRDIMTAKVKQLRIHEESSLTLKREDVDHLYAYGQLGDSSPDAIINTLWLMNTIRLNIKGCKKHADLKWGDITLQTVSGGKEVLVYAGSNLFIQKDVRRPSRCFVNLYKKYWAMRPQDTLDDDSPFYLAPGDQGFKRSKYGSRIGTVFKRMLINGGLSSDLKITNIDIL